MTFARALFVLGPLGLPAAVGLVAACSSSTTTPGGSSADGGGDSTTGTGDSGGGSPDSAVDDGGPKGYGSECDAGAQCQSNVCFANVGDGGGGGGGGGGAKSFCSERCDAAAQCPNPPFTSCNRQGYCRIP